MERPSHGEASNWQTYRRLLAYVWPYSFLFVLSTLGFLVGSSAEGYFVKLFGDLVNDWDGGLADAAVFIPVTMFALVMIRAVGEIIGEILLSHISFSVVHRLRVELFNQLLQLPSAFFDASAQGHLVSRITFNVAQLRDTGTDALKSVIQDGGKVIVFLSWMLYLSWELTLIFIASVPVVAIVVLFASGRFRKISRRVQRSMGDVTHVASETVSGYRVVRTFGGEQYERERFYQASHTNRRQNLKMVVTKAASTHVVQIMVVAAVCVLIAVLARPEFANELSRGELVTFLGLAGMLARPVRKLTEVNARLQRGLAAAEDIFSQLDEQEEKDEGSYTTDRVEGHIEFRGVGFSYAQGTSEAVLREIDLEVPSGHTVAVVGKSGSGKSTLVSLIPRFYDVEKGTILIDGTPIEEYTRENLRKQIALVTQQVTLFNDTLKRNIAYGVLADCTDEQIAEAIERAHADVFINELPKGLDTIVGDNGVLLSGGQRQRVAITRALLKNAPVLILDEATSALDTAAERHIQAALDEVMRGRTTLVIAHRLSTVENADTILVMDDGRIVERGDHASLIEQGGMYSELYNAQFEESEMAVSSAPRFSTRRRARGPVDIGQSLTSLASGWYQGTWWTHLLRPLSGVFSIGSKRRRHQFRTGKKQVWRASIPVIVVGNITVGGTGKTPLVVWLCKWLRNQGFRPGIVSRGYGGATGKKAARVPALEANPSDYGDEAVLLVRRTACPVFVCPQRVDAVKMLLEETDCDIVVCDDGLQHYALARDLEIAVIDGFRGVGNGRLLPAGPLREPMERLEDVDWIVSNGRESGVSETETVVDIDVLRFVNVHTHERVSVDEFVDRHPVVHAVAGIGNPARFAMTLRELGLSLRMHAFDDHHRFEADDLQFDDDYPVVCTEKDAVKLAALALQKRQYWYAEIDLIVPEAAEALLLDLLCTRGIRPSPALDVQSRENPNSLTPENPPDRSGQQG
jgi:subfamily B ATP-binding cassette protein MsbA